MLLVPAIATGEAAPPRQANPQQQAVPQQAPPPIEKKAPTPPPPKKQDPPRKAPRKRPFTRKDLLACGDRAANAVDDDKVSSALAAELHPAPPPPRHAQDLAAVCASLRDRPVEDRARKLLALDLAPGDRTSSAFVQIVRETIVLEPKTDATRADLVELASIAGLASDANAIAGRITDARLRATAEAKVAAELALSDPDGGAVLARQALQRAPRDPTVRTFATAALARAGDAGAASELGGEVAVTDVAIGLRGDPAAFATWWRSLNNEGRAHLIASVLRDLDDRGDAGFLGTLCANP